MKAAILLKNGDPTSDEVLAVQDDVEVPTLAAGEILVKVAAAAINPIDWKLMKGEFPGKKSGPIGFDVSGTVEKIADDTTDTDVHHHMVGDKVYANTAATQGGSFAEYVRVQAIAAHKVPSSVDMVQAAALPLAGLTALQGLRTQGAMEEGNKVCILGGSGGVGSLAVQMAKAMGASEVWSTGSNVNMIKKLGADRVINYKEESVLESLKDQQFDVIYDTIGGVEAWKAALQGGLKKEGRYVTIVGDGGGMPATMLTLVWRKLKSKVGLCPSYNLFLTDTKAPAVLEDMKKMTELVESGKVKPVLDERTFELTTESIHELVEASMSHRAKGKLVVKVDVPRASIISRLVGKK